MTSCGTEVSSRIDVIVVPTRFHPHVTGSFKSKVRSPLPQSCLLTVSTVQSSWKKSPTFHHDDFYNIFLTLMTSSVHFDLYDVSLTPIFCIFHPFSPHLILQRFSPFFHLLINLSPLLQNDIHFQNSNHSENSLQSRISPQILNFSGYKFWCRCVHWTRCKSLKSVIYLKIQNFWCHCGISNIEIPLSMRSRSTPKGGFKVAFFFTSPVWDSQW